jgi:hypothetical protein
VVIGNGKPEEIGPLAEDTGFSGTIVTDPGLETYRALIILMLPLLAPCRTMQKYLD